MFKMLQYQVAETGFGPWESDCRAHMPLMTVCLFIHVFIHLCIHCILSCWCRHPIYFTWFWEQDMGGVGGIWQVTLQPPWGQRLMWTVVTEKVVSVGSGCNARLSVRQPGRGAGGQKLVSSGQLSFLPRHFYKSPWCLFVFGTHSCVGK